MEFYAATPTSTEKLANGEFTHADRKRSSIINLGKERSASETINFDTIEHLNSRMARHNKAAYEMNMAYDAHSVLRVKFAASIKCNQTRNVAPFDSTSDATTECAAAEEGLKSEDVACVLETEVESASFNFCG